MQSKTSSVIDSSFDTSSGSDIEQDDCFGIPRHFKLALLEEVDKAGGLQHLSIKGLFRNKPDIFGDTTTSDGKRNKKAVENVIQFWKRSEKKGNFDNVRKGIASGSQTKRRSVPSSLSSSSSARSKKSKTPPKQSIKSPIASPIKPSISVTPQITSRRNTLSKLTETTMSGEREYHGMFCISCC